MSVNSQRCWMLSFFPFLIWIGFYTRTRDTAESPHNRRSSRGATLHGSAKRNANVAVLPRTDAGSSRERTPGSTVFENCWLDMRSWLTATKPWFVLLQQSSVGGKLLLLTDRFLVLWTPPPPFSSPTRSHEVEFCNNHVLLFTCYVTRYIIVL